MAHADSVLLLDAVGREVGTGPVVALVPVGAALGVEGVDLAATLLDLHLVRHADAERVAVPEAAPDAREREK